MGRCNTIRCIESTMLARENHLFGRARSKPSQSNVPADLIESAVLAFVLNRVLGYSRDS
jgi:hypothetical protein